MVRLLIELGIQVDNLNKVGNPGIVNAISYNHLDIVKILCQHGAKIEGITLENNLTIIDLAILHGRYDISQYIFSRLSSQNLKTSDEYQQIAQKYFLRYVNYDMMIEGLTSCTPADKLGDILTRPIIPKDEEEQEEICCWCCFPISVFEWKNKGKKAEKSGQEAETERRTNQQ